MTVYDELCQIAREIELYYDIDKIKPYAIYIWSKTYDVADLGENLFDIHADGIEFFVKDHEIIEEAKPIIAKIQAKLRELEALKYD